MSIVMQLNPYEFFVDTAGTALDSGYIWIGEVNKDPRNYPVTVYYDEALTIPAAMPLRTTNGYVYRNGSPTFLYIDGNYSILVLQKTGTQVYYVPDFLMISSGRAISLDEFNAFILGLGDADGGLTIGNPKNIAELRTVIKPTLVRTSPYVLSVSGYYAEGDGGGGDFWYDASDTTSVDNGGTIIVAADGGRWKRYTGASILTSWFGSKGDRVANDTVAVQAAIDYCNSSTIARPMVIVGSCKITAPLNIDRPVEGTNGDFRISGAGPGSGIYVDTAIVMFSSRLPYGVNLGPTYTQDPCTEYTQFEGVEFVSSSAALAASVFDSKYLRLTFTDCSFRKIKAILAAQYLQTIKFLNCRMRQHTGTFFLAMDIYNLVVNECEYEISGAAFAWTGVARGVSFNENLYEGSAGPFISGTGSVALSVSNHYFESNGSPDIVLGNSGGATNGATIDGNLFFLSGAQAADPAFYPVILGIGTGISANGNISSGNIFNNNSVLPFGLGAGRNVAAAGRLAFSSNPYSVSGLTAHAGGGQALATPVTRDVTIFTVTATANDSAVLPSVTVMEALTVITVINRGAANLAVFPAVGERFLGFAVNVATVVAPLASARFVREAGDAWVFL